MVHENTLKEKTGKWLLKNSEDALKNFLVPRLPKQLETYHLTWLTLLWSGFMVLSFSLGTQNSLYYWAVPILVMLQYITDLLDGALGRYRNTGLVKWGYYVDHFLDFVFLCSIIFGYALITGFTMWVFLLLALAGGFMIHTFLLVSTNEEFKISIMRLGPTEGRGLFILFHTALLLKDIEMIGAILPYIVCTGTLLLAYVFITSQIKLWEIDMSMKNK